MSKLEKSIELLAEAYALNAEFKSLEREAQVSMVRLKVVNKRMGEINKSLHSITLKLQEIRDAPEEKPGH